MSSAPKSEFLHVMQERGFYHDCTDLDALDAAMSKGVVPGYIGFDATAESLHVGSSIQIMILRWLQKTGHKPLVLMGGGTSKVGDPSFRSDERSLLGVDKIAQNIEGIKKVFSKFLSFGEGDTDALMLNNADWLDHLNYLEFLRDVGQHFSVNRMLSFESVKSRMDREQSLSFLEFNYMILQAFDFKELNARHSCMVQFGGSDQWGNIVNGIDLTRRVLDHEIFGLTSPVDECDRLGALEGSDINEAKIILANEVTTLLHGVEAAKAAEATAKEVFEKGGVGDDLPTLTLTNADVGDGISIVQLIVKSGLAGSGKEAKRLIAENGAKVNDAPLDNAGLMVDAAMLATPMKLSAGKKRHALVQLG